MRRKHSLATILLVAVCTGRPDATCVAAPEPTRLRLEVGDDYGDGRGNTKLVVLSDTEVRLKGRNGELVCSYKQDGDRLNLTVPSQNAKKDYSCRLTRFGMEIIGQDARLFLDSTLLFSPTGNVMLHTKRQLAAPTVKDFSTALSDAMSQGFDIDTPDFAGNTLLHDSANDAERFSLLLSKGADPNATTGTKDTPLSEAAARGRVENVNALIKKGVNVNSKDHLSATPLHRAAYFGHKDVAASLLAAGADAKTPNQFGNTPLHEFGGAFTVNSFVRQELDAARVSEIKDLAVLLVKAGADPNAKNRDGRTPLQLATKDQRQLAIIAALKAVASAP